SQKMRLAARRLEDTPVTAPVCEQRRRACEPSTDEYSLSFLLVSFYSYRLYLMRPKGRTRSLRPKLSSRRSRRRSSVWSGTRWQVTGIKTTREAQGRCSSSPI